MAPPSMACRTATVIPSSLPAWTGLTDTVVAPTPDRLPRPHGRPAAMVLQSGRNGGFIGAQDNSRPESCDLTRYIGIGIPLEWRLIANLLERGVAKPIARVRFPVVTKAPLTRSDLSPRRI